MPPKKSSKKDDQLEQKSPAEFFAENKNIAGFDNVRGSCARPVGVQASTQILRSAFCLVETII